MRRLLVLFLTVSLLACNEGPDMSRPCILYESLIEDATLTASSTATGYSVDSLKTRQTADRWTSQAGTNHTITAQLASATLPTAWAMTRHDLPLSTKPELDDEDFSTTENPLATGWTDVGDQALQATGGAATDSGMTSLGVGELRAYVRSGSAATPGLSQWVQADVTFPAIGVSGRDVAVMLRDSADGSYVAVHLWNDGTGVNISSYNGTDDTAGGGTIGDSFTPVAATSYDIELVWNYSTSTVQAYRDDVLVTSLVITGLPSDFSPNQQGILQTQSTTGGSGSAQWANFKSGVTSASGSGVGVVVLKGGTDGATWPYRRAFVFESSGTYIGSFDDASSYEYWQWEFPLQASGSLTIGCLALGRRLDFTESMAQGFDPKARSLKVHQNRSNSGESLGQVVRWQEQAISLRFGPAGLSTVDFFETTGTPSWEEFIDDFWGYGKSFWFAWDITQRPRDMWFCMSPRKARTGSPFITAIRRGWKFGFDVLVEGVGS